jgi:hypothetical protein
VTHVAGIVVAEKSRGIQISVPGVLGATSFGANLEGRQGQF